MNSRNSSRASEARSLAPPPGRPYPGLRPFRPDEADRFCGREEQREAMLVKLEASRFLAVLGASGSGKSSLVIAGLVADVGDGNLFGVAPDCLTLICRPGLDPYRSLAETLAESCLQGHRNWITTDAAERMLRSGSGGLLKCHEHATAFLKTVNAAPVTASEAPPEPPAFLVVVDQFEELFRFAGLHVAELKQRLNVEEVARRTMPLDSPRDEAGEFVSQLLHTVSQPAPVLVVLTMRSDYLGDCEQFPGLPAAISDHQFLVPRLTRAQRATAIEQPLALFGAAAEEGLVNRIINELGECDDLLPVLQHALARTWQMAERRSGGAPPEMLFHADYEAAGGVGAALQRHGEELLALAAKDQSALVAPERVARFFRCLLDVDEANRLVRRPVLLAEAMAESGLSEAEARCLAENFRSEGNNLLMPPPQEDLTGLSVLDVSHESLLRRWPLATEWKNEEYNWRQILRRLQSYVDDRELPPSWLVQRSTALYKNSTPTQGWAQRYGCDWNKIADSVRRAKAELRRRRNLAWAGGAIVLLMIASLAFIWLQHRQVGELKSANKIAEDERRIAQEERDKADILRNEATLELDAFKDRNREQIAETDRLKADIVTLQTTVIKLGGQLPQLTDYPPPPPIATSAQDDLTWQVPSLLQGHVRPVKAVLFAPLDPPLLFTGALDGSLWPWDLAGNAVGEAFNFEVAEMALSPDGHSIATASGDSTCHVIRLRPKPLTSWTFQVKDRAPLESFARALKIKTEDVLAHDSNDGKLKPWLQSVQSSATNDPATGGPYLPAGVTVTLARGVQASAPEAFEPWQKSEACSCVAWVNGERLVCGGTGGSVALWDFKNREWIGGPAVRGRHKGAVNSVAVSPDGKRALTSSDDGTAILWLNEGLETITFDAGAPVRDASFSPDGDFILIPAGERGLGLHVIKNPARAQRLSMEPWHAAPIVTGKFSPDGKFVATIDVGGTVKLWRLDAPLAGRIPPVTLKEGDLAGRARHRGLRGDKGAYGAMGPRGYGAEPDPPGSLAWAQDGDLLILAAGDNQGVVRVWHLRGNEEPVLHLRWVGHSGPVTNLTISPNARFVASASADRTAALLPIRLSIAGPWQSYRIDMPADKGLEFYSPKEADAITELFGPARADGKTGLAWRLRDDDVLYVSAAWDYRLLDRTSLKKTKVRVRNLSNGKVKDAIPVDFGAASGKAAHVSAAVVKALDLKPDDRIELELPPGIYNFGRASAK